MSFFDKKQEVIDVKLTQFGKNTLARGLFKPVYYRFFDDDILYNSECAGISEAQNSSESRILETQRMKTQHLTVGVETSFDQNQNEINSGSLRTFVEISKRQDPLVTDSMLKYSLENCSVNSQVSPRITVNLPNLKSNSSSKSTKAKEVDLLIPQLNITSSYTLTRDIRNKVPDNEVPDILHSAESYIDLSKKRIQFLDNTLLTIEGKPLVVDLEEFGVDHGLDNFELEIFEVIEEGEEQTLVRLETREELNKYFNIKTDNMVEEVETASSRGRRPRGRN